MSSSAAFQHWIDEARISTVADELQRRGITALHERNMPCPSPGCGGTDRFAVNLRKNIWICRATGAGGDAIALCQHLDGTTFVGAVETLTGRPPPGRPSAETDEERRARHERLAAAAEVAHRKAAEAVIADDRFREAERQRAHLIWRSGRPIGGTPAEAYLRLRGIGPIEGLRLRYLPKAPLWDRAPPEGRLVHEGPMMLAPIVRDGRFAGVHQTWIDLADPDGKARVPDATGVLLPAKKIRGSKRGGRIEIGPAPESATRVYLGEGIETMLSVRQAMQRVRPALFRDSIFWSSVDLGNLAGKASQGIAHPTLKILDKRGRERSQTIPGPVPKAGETPIALPPGVTELVLIGDGDSEPEMTRLAMLRAKALFERTYEAIAVAIVMAPAGQDFNNVLRGQAA